MSDLIERIKSGAAFTTPDEIVKELEAQQAENERLRDGLGVMLAAFSSKAFSVAKIRAVKIARAALEKSK